MSSVNLYDVLDVSNEATPNELKKAYRKLVKEFYPDKPSGSIEMFELITHAYNVLANDESRKEYDALYKLSEQSGKDHTSLKAQAKGYYKAQESDVTKKSKEELDADFKKVMSDFDRKHGYKREKDADKIDPKDFERRLNDLKQAIEQDDIELAHEDLFEGGKFDLKKFNAAFDAMHKGPDELIPHSGNPDAWLGFDPHGSNYSSIDKYDELYIDDGAHMGVSGQNYSSVNFDAGKKKKLTKKDIEKIKGADYTSGHNNAKGDTNYAKSLEEKLREREIEDRKYQDRDLKDFDTDPNCGGYGIFKDLGITAGSLEWNNNEEDIQKRYNRLLELRGKDK